MFLTRTQGSEYIFLPLMRKICRVLLLFRIIYCRVHVCFMKFGLDVETNTSRDATVDIRVSVDLLY